MQLKRKKIQRPKEKSSIFNTLSTLVATYTFLGQLIDQLVSGSKEVQSLLPATQVEFSGVQEIGTINEGCMSNS